MSEETVVHEVEGPKGKATIYEVPTVQPSGVQVVDYIVRCGDKEETTRALGAAYAIAQELAGA
jgi:hypothetical protein